MARLFKKTGLWYDVRERIRENPEEGLYVPVHCVGLERHPVK